MPVLVALLGVVSGLLLLLILAGAAPLARFVFLLDGLQLLFGFALQLCFGLADPLQAAFGIRQFFGKGVRRLPLAKALVFFFIVLLGFPQQFFDKILPILLAFAQLLVAHRTAGADVGLDLGAINYDVAELHQASLLAQLQRLHEQASQRF